MKVKIRKNEKGGREARKENMEALLKVCPGAASKASIYYLDCVVHPYLKLSIIEVFSNYSETSRIL